MRSSLVAAGLLRRQHTILSEGRPPPTRGDGTRGFTPPFSDANTPQAMSGQGDRPTDWPNTRQVPVAELAMTRDSSSRACDPSCRWGSCGCVAKWHTHTKLVGTCSATSTGQAAPRPKRPAFRAMTHARGVYAHACVSVPLVLGMPGWRGSSSTAIRSERARPL